MSNASDANSAQEDYPEDSERESGESESGDDAGGLLDLEASESDGDEDSSDADSGSDGEDAQDNELLDGTTTVGFWDGLDFPQFSRLPPELRACVWECFCSMVLQRPRVLDFNIVLARGSPVFRWQAVPGSLLARGMESVCAMLAVNHESRAIALRAFPDKLAIYGPGGHTVRFDKSSDVVLVSLTDLCPGLPDTGYTIPGFSEHVEHLAVDYLHPGHSDLCSFLGTFGNLRTLYEATKNADLPPRKFQWCGSSDAVHTYHVDHSELDEVGIERHIPLSFVWPDLARHRDYATTAICPEVRTVGMEIPRFDELAEAGGEPIARLKEVEIWPMIWGFEELMKIEFDDLSDMVDEDEDEDDGSDLEDFIDDEPHEEASLHDDNTDSEDDLMANGQDAHEHEHDAEGGVHLGGAAGVDDSDEENAYNQSFNGFSPIEPDSDVDPGQGASLNVTGTAVNDDEEEDQGRPRPGKRARSRRRVVSDDDEEEESRPVKRSKRRQVVTSDSEDDGPSATSEEEDRAKKRAKTRRSRAMISDEDEEEAGDLEELEPVYRHGRKRAVHVASESESEDEEDGESEASPSDSGEDEDEDEDEEGGGSRPLTLAEKLGMHRRANPVSSDDEEVASSDADERRGDYGENYEDEDEEDDYGNGNLVDRYGEEPESEGDPGSDEEDGW